MSDLKLIKVISNGKVWGTDLIDVETGRAMSTVTRLIIDFNSSGDGPVKATAEFAGVAADIEIYGNEFYKKKYRDPCYGNRVIDLIFSELQKAEEKHPTWPEDQIRAVGVLVEEAGESMQAAINFTYSGGDIERLREELAQTGAMAIRALLNLPQNDDCRHE